MPKIDPATIPLADAGQPTEKMLERFWSKVAIGDPDDCWPWLRGSRNGGYGVFAVGPGSQRVATRVAYSFHHGVPVPGHLMVRHDCDNPPCVNPAHLILGTQVDNMRDMHERGRRSSQKGRRAGLASHLSLINLEIANAIRVDLATGMLLRQISEKYGVSMSHISRIKRGESWPGY